MRKKRSPPLEGELLQGTLDLLILQTLVLGPTHGHTIAYAIEHRSEDALQAAAGVNGVARTPKPEVRATGVNNELDSIFSP